MTIDLTAYAEFLRSRNAADRTVRDRVWFARRLLADADPASITEDDLRAYLADPEFSRATRATYYAHMVSLFRWLARTGRIDVDPTLDMDRPPSPKPAPRPMTPDQAHRALAHAAARVEQDTYALLLLGMYAGLRAHEAAKLHSRDVTELHVHVVGKGERRALIPTHPLIWAEAQRRGPGYWFPSRDGHWTALTVSLRVSRLFWAVGLDGSFHRCRHYYGTSLLRAGVNIRVVQELMRHASLATTAAYLGVDDDEKKAAIAMLGA